MAEPESLCASLREYADRDTGYIYANEVATLKAAADEIERLRETLKWLQFALDGWAVFRERQTYAVHNSGEMRDILARIASVVGE